MARIRTFIAVAIGPAIQERASALQEKLALTAAGVKWVEPGSMHITLLFLGQVAELDLVPICRIVNKGVRGIAPFDMAIGGLGVFPTPRRPKVLWAGVKEGAESMRQIHAHLEAPLLEQGGYRREERGYNPHLTLGRITHDERTSAWGPLLANYANWEGGTTRVEEVLVMSSELRRDGPVYTVMGRARLND